MASIDRLAPGWTKIESGSTQGNDMLKKFSAGVGVIALWIGFAGLVAFHLYTAWLINKEWGAFWGIMAFGSPPFGDVYWLFHEWNTNGITSFWFQCLGGIVVALGVGASFIWLSDVLDKRDRRTV